MLDLDAQKPLSNFIEVGQITRKIVHNMCRFEELLSQWVRMEAKKRCSQISAIRRQRRGGDDGTA